MQKLLKDYLDELKKKQKRRRKAAIAALLVGIMLVSGVAWNLTQYGVAMTGEPKCGKEEHQHSEECYKDVLICGMEENAGHTHTRECYETQSQLVCGQEEDPDHTHSESCYKTEDVLICGQEESAGHTHTDACYERQLVCGQEEHIHSDICFIDTDADVEDASVWDAQYANTEWKNVWGEDLAQAAGMQIGYKESADNYSVAEDKSHKGYTRYGQFAEDVYADWDAAFVNFCMHYAGLEETNLFPKETETAKWYDKFAKANEGKNAEFLTDATDYEPQIGDIAFFQKENEETENQMGIVSSYNKEKNEIKVIEGNCNNAVKENKYAANDTHIKAYLKITELETAYKNVDAAEEQEETVFAEELSCETENVVITVGAVETGIIPKGASLKAVPIVADDPETAEQYQDVEAKLQEKAENEEYDIAGFLAYDISFVDADGNKIEPNGDVKVTMEYKAAELPKELKDIDAELLDVTVIHLEEDEQGEVENIVDLSQAETSSGETENKIEVIETTDAQEIEKAVFETDSFSTYTLLWSNTMYGMDGNRITQTNYNSYLTAMKKTVETSTDSNLPIMNWKRSSGYVGKDTSLTGNENDASKWKWSDVANLSLDVTGDQVWDGSRVGSAGATRNYKEYMYVATGYYGGKSYNVISAYNGALYDSATWECKKDSGTLYRFQGEFSLGENEDPDAYTYTMKQVIPGDSIYINDDFWVFVHPKDVTLTDDNYMNYLAFWTGTRNKGGEVYFNGRKGTRATQGAKEGLALLTDGWHMDAIENNVGSIIQSCYAANQSRDYVVDVIADDYAGGGGMYRLAINRKQANNMTVTFKKTSTDGFALSGAEFSLEDDSHSVYYTATSDENGMVTFKGVVPDKTYTMKEIKAPSGYVKATTVWTVDTKADKSFTITSGNEVVENDNGTYVIKNKSNTTTTTDATVNKTAEVVNEAERIFKIDLTASSASTVTTEGRTNPIDVVLVLDVSGSMGWKDAGVAGSTVSYRDLDDDKTYYVEYNGKIYKVAYKNWAWRYAEASNDVNRSSSTLATLTSDYKTLTYHTDATTRLAAMKTAAKAFIENLAGKSSESNVAIVTFSSSSSTEAGLTQLNASGVSALKSAIDGLTANGGTYPASSIEKAHDLLKNSQNEKHIIVLGDGNCGQSPSNPSEDERNDAIANADAAKADGIIIHAIRFVTEDGMYLDKIVSEGETVYSATNVDTLIDSFDLIIESSTKVLPIIGAKVVDTIDSRFIVTDAEGNALTDGAEIGAGGILRVKADGTQYIEWTDQTINPAGEDSTPGWSGQIYVKAKDDFIGGNAIPTNGKATLTYPGGGKEFPKPSVNVKLLDLSLTGNETTVYKGDTIEAGSFISGLENSLEVRELVKDSAGKVITTTTGLPASPVLTDDQKAALKNGETITIGDNQAYKYTYPGTTDPVGYFKYTYTIAGETAEVADHEATRVGDKVEEYTLKVEFVPYKESERQSIVGSITPPNPDKNSELGIKKGGSEVGTISAEASHIVNVIAGEIQITKKLDPSAINEDEDQNFVFTISGPNGFSKEVTITIPKGESEGSYVPDGNNNTELYELKRGEYTVSEKLMTGFEIQDVPVVDNVTNCFVSGPANDQVTFEMGYAGETGDDKYDVISAKQYDKGVLGKVVFTNEKVYSTWAIRKVSASTGNPSLQGAEFELKSTDGTTYKGTSNEDGIVTWVDGNKQQIEKLPKGSYTLEETKAPAGYYVSDEQWTLEIVKNGALKSIQKDGTPIELKSITIAGKTIVCFDFENSALYALPEAGGPGIYWYIFGGVLLMAAAMLIIYKNKCKEVLRS